MFRVSLLISAMALLLLAACIPVAPTPVTPITWGRATGIALQLVTMPWPEVTAVENPRNPVARLMKLREYDEGYSAGNPFLPDPDTLVWVVQYEGVSYSAFPGAPEPREQYNYATVVIDAQSGTVIAMSRAPFFPP